MGRIWMKIKKGDTVKVIAGKDKGATRARSSRSTEVRARDRRGRQPRQEAHQGR